MCQRVEPQVRGRTSPDSGVRFWAQDAGGVSCRARSPPGLLVEAPTYHLGLWDCRCHNGWLLSPLDADCRANRPIAEGRGSAAVTRCMPRGSPVPVCAVGAPARRTHARKSAKISTGAVHAASPARVIQPRNHTSSSPTAAEHSSRPSTRWTCQRQAHVYKCKATKTRRPGDGAGNRMPDKPEGACTTGTRAGVRPSGADVPASKGGTASDCTAWTSTSRCSISNACKEALTVVPAGPRDGAWTSESASWRTSELETELLVPTFGRHSLGLTSGRQRPPP